ncbi:hypothetical protein Leryth_001885 [Lithospermum erythrorhizon]|nr:hypothetical protein Leryth_001885 [Lithospermum erythrorhizon]
MDSLVEGSKGVDASLGGLVWVRRRNGRWWPGRILGPEELPESLPSQKSGTAIKLLGREDASVDWYNVEKSTRVKAFRCGEYDGCIEQAEVTAANSSKKVVKYASKEDAILHALEIERACLPKDHPGSNSTMTNQEHEVDDSPTSFHHNGEECNNMDEDSSNSSVSPEDPSYTGAYKEQTMERTSNDTDDGGTEGLKHIKGLDKLGTPVITSSKRKRFQVAHVHEFLKKEHRRRTVTGKLESKMRVSVPVVYEKLAHPTRSLPRGASFREVSSLGSNSTMIQISLKHTDMSSDDGLYVVPIVTEEQHCADLRSLMYNTSERAHVSSETKSNESSQVEAVSMGESGSTSSCTAEVNNIIQGVDKTISKWQLKRKRSRHSNKNRRQNLRKFTDVYDEFDAYVAGAECSVDDNTFSASQPSANRTHPLTSKAVADIKREEDQRWSWNTSHKDAHGSQASIEQHAQQTLMPHREPRFSMNSKYQKFIIRRHPAEYFLFDVNLEVKANYRPKHVPYVSLTSKLTGQSIIGHPLTVEVLEEGFDYDIVSDLGWYSSISELDEEVSATTSAMGGVKVDLEATPNLVERVPLKHALQNVTQSKLRKCGLLRTLSSLTGAREELEEKKLIVENVRGPSLACVPLTIAFSRLNEAFNCPNRPMHRL